MDGEQVTVSIVSHRQNCLVSRLLDDLQRNCNTRLRVILTENAPDSTPLRLPEGRHDHQIILNDRPKGFGANHNAAFLRCGTRTFCVLNPDIRILADPFPPLLDALRDARVAVAAPLVRSPSGGIEDSVRRFPTFGILLRKLVRGASGPDYPVDRGSVTVDWAAGMFLVFKADSFREARGFDERYFMYYEDIDLCRRMGQAGGLVKFVPDAAVIHDARRGSHRNPRLAFHHAMSMARFLATSYRRQG